MTYNTASFGASKNSIIDDFMDAICQAFSIKNHNLYEIYDPSKVSAKKRIKNLFGCFDK